MLSTFSNSLCSYKSNISEASLASYQRFVDILTILSSVCVPTCKPGLGCADLSSAEIMSSPDVLTNPGLLSVFKGLSGVYLTRIPIWDLLRNPWTMIEPIMPSYPDISMKIFNLKIHKERFIQTDDGKMQKQIYYVDLCDLLRLNKNAYLSKQLIASYSRSKALSNQSQGDYSIYENIESGITSITDLTHKVGVLKWVFDQVSVT